MLQDCDTWAVVGLSGDPHRTAFGIARFLQAHGKRIVPVHPSAPTVLGEQGYATLADVPVPVDVVDVFRRSEAAGAFADQAVAVGARAVWFQLGVVDERGLPAHHGRGRADGDGHLPGHRVAAAPGQEKPTVRLTSPRTTRPFSRALAASRSWNRSIASRSPASPAARIRTASSPALRALPTATVATGTPAGICTIDSSESSPSRCFSATGTPITGSGVTAASIPGRWAAPPAPATMTRRPRPAASLP